MKADSSIKGTGKGPVAGSSTIINGTTTGISATTITTMIAITTMTAIAGSSLGITGTLFGVLVTAGFKRRDTEVSAPSLKSVSPGAESTSALASLTFPLHTLRFPTGMRVDGLQKTA